MSAGGAGLGSSQPARSRGPAHSSLPAPLASSHVPQARPGRPGAGPAVAARSSCEAEAIRARSLGSASLARPDARARRQRDPGLGRWQLGGHSNALLLLPLTGGNSPCYSPARHRNRRLLRSLGSEEADLPVAMVKKGGGAMSLFFLGTPEVTPIRQAGRSGGRPPLSSDERVNAHVWFTRL